MWVAIAIVAALSYVAHARRRHLDRGVAGLNRVGQVQVVVLRQMEDAWHVLMLKRSAAAGDFWQPVTGGINPEEDPAKAALREMGEETGIMAYRPPSAKGGGWFRRYG